ncbi:hypothetical protein [Hyphococcus luteus]|uniref:Uncharacterized protein n=1 Tax=Hyphococcus luteus TaxID=2058213 RepID=A0A2S7K650_9PROT|nr:hypothetical protein [Marinicaulis flavus]PQA87994.1 hypothetical protein CW354_06570 [Marinicaulis flavus]
MNNQEAAALLMQDIEANMTYLQIGVLAASFMLALIGLVLALRAYNVLSEARMLFWQAGAGVSPASKDEARAARAAAIRAASAKKKIKSNRVRGVI